MDFDYRAGDDIRTGYLARPPIGKRAPGVLVLHGGGGLGAHARERADRLASLGYVAFAPDLFGHPVVGVEAAKALTGSLVEDWLELRSRCVEALEVLRTQPDVDPSRLAVIGFCFGGQAALELARGGVQLSAVVGFHSELKTLRPEDSRAIRAKVLVCLGDRDRFVGREDREAFLENMTASGVDCQLLVFSGVGHSFTDRHAARSGVTGLKYDAVADRRSWAAMTLLLDEVFHGDA